MNAVDQPLVGYMQQRHAGGFVDPAALGLNDAVFDQVGHANAMTAPDTVGFQRQRHVVLKGLAVELDRQSLFKANADLLGWYIHVGTPERHIHDWVDNVQAVLKKLEILGLMRGPPQV